MDITSSFQGITSPISELYNEIHMRGWQVTKVDIKDGYYVATAKNPHGEQAEKFGRDQNTALGALLMYIMRREHIRQGAWSQHWGDQLESIAQAYAKAPHFDPKAAAAWKELADDCVARAHVISQQLAIELTHDPHPYESPQDMWEDVQKKRHLFVSDAASEHPVWTRDQVIAFRICHDVLGHAAAGGDFGWTGTNMATAAHMPYLTPTAQQALFSETVGKSAYNNYYKGFGPQKVALLPDHIQPLQDAENGPGHGGEHPSMSLVPGVLPTRSSATINEVDTGYGGKAMQSEWSARRPFIYVPETDTIHVGEWGTHHPYIGFHAGLGESEPTTSGPSDTKAYGWMTTKPEWFGGQVIGFYGSKNPRDANIRQTLLEAYSHELPTQEELPEEPDIDWDDSTSHISGALRDPNYQYDTGIEPPMDNAITMYGDPLEHMKVKDQAHALNTGWANFEDHDGKPDLERIKGVIMNAFRAALLSPLKQLKWNAVHYQDLQHIPHHVSDPKVYWGALENARINHNRAVGFPDPEIRHKAHYEALLDFYRYFARHNPELTPSQVKDRADREVMVMQAEIEESLLGKSKDTEAEIIEPKVTKELDKRLKGIIKDDKPLITANVENPYDENRQAYGGFIGRHLIAIAQLSKYSDILAEAALEDVKKHDGSGHVFRATALRLGVPYVGPKIVSFAWLLLQPLTSQLATVDTHMVEALGYKYKDVANNRDYFRLERELQAGRDASGYSHMPLGQFQWGLWDYKRTGPGTHQDHTPLKAYEPTPHHQVVWKDPLPGNSPHKPEWIAPEWWSATQPYRDAESVKWTHDIATRYPKGQIPWTEQEALAPHVAGDDGTSDEVHLALDVPEWVRKKIAEFVGTLDIKATELIDPAEYHMTVAYAPHGAEYVDAHAVKNNFNLTGLKFEGGTLTTLGDAGALVIELENEDFDAYASSVNNYLEDEWGIEVSRYDTYTPHITVAYIHGEAPKAELSPLSFRTGPMSFSTPRHAPEIPSIWAKHLAHRLASNDWLCPQCNFNFGEHKPEIKINTLDKDPQKYKYCPACGSDLKYNPPKQQHDPDQMNFNQIMPTEVKRMPASSRPSMDSSYPQRLTTAYDSHNNIMYIGPTNSWHSHLGRHFNIPVKEGEFSNALKDNADHFYVGQIKLPYTPDEYDEYPSLENSDVSWYHRTPENHEQILNALESHGWSPPSEPDDDVDIDWDDDDDLDELAGLGEPKPTQLPPQVPSFVTKGEAPVGTIFTVSNDPTEYKVVSNNGQKVMIGRADGKGSTGDHEAQHIWPTEWKVKSVAQPSNEPHKTFGEFPVGTQFESTSGLIWEIADDAGGKIKIIPVSDKNGLELSEAAKSPTWINPTDEVPKAWTPLPQAQNNKWDFEGVGQDEFAPFNEGQIVEHKAHPGIEFEINDVLDMAYEENEGKPKEWLLKPQGGGASIWSTEGEIITADQASGAQPQPPDMDSLTVGEAFTHPKWPDAGILTFDKVDPNGGNPIAKFHSTGYDGGTFQIPPKDIGGLQPYTPTQPNPQPIQTWKVGDIAMINEDAAEEKYYIDHVHPYKTVSFNNGIATIMDFDGNLHEVPEGYLEKPNSLDAVRGEEEFGHKNESGLPPSLTGDHHAPFAITNEGQRYRIGDWTSNNDAYDVWKQHDDQRIAGGNNSTIQVGTPGAAPQPISHFAVRSGGDPGYNSAPRIHPGQIIHPPASPFVAGKTYKTLYGSQEPVKLIQRIPHPEFNMWEAINSSGQTVNIGEHGLGEEVQPPEQSPGTFSRVWRAIRDEVTA